MSPMIKRNVWSTLGKRGLKCKFTRSCSLYTNTSYTCTHVGGSYCGKYRSLAKLTEKNLATETDRKLTERHLVH